MPTAPADRFTLWPRIATTKPPAPKSSPTTQQILPNSSFSMPSCLSLCTVPSCSISSFLSSGLFVLGCTQVPDILFSSGVRSSKRYPTKRLSSEPYRSLLGRLFVEGFRRPSRESGLRQAQSTARSPTHLTGNRWARPSFVPPSVAVEAYPPTTKDRPRCSCSTTRVLPSSPSSTRLGDAEVRGEEHERRLLWRRSGHRYAVVVLAIGQRSLLPRYQRPDALALLQYQREPVDLFVRHAVCSLPALPSCWFQELIFHALLG